MGDLSRFLKRIYGGFQNWRYLNIDSLIYFIMENPIYNGWFGGTFIPGTPSSKIDWLLFQATPWWHMVTSWMPSCDPDGCVTISRDFFNRIVQQIPSIWNLEALYFASNDHLNAIGQCKRLVSTSSVECPVGPSLADEKFCRSLPDLVITNEILTMVLCIWPYNGYITYIPPG